MSISPRISSGSIATSSPASCYQNAPFSVTSLLSPLDAALASAPSYASSLGAAAAAAAGAVASVPDPLGGGFRGISSSYSVTGGAGGGGGGGVPSYSPSSLGSHAGLGGHPTVSASGGGLQSSSSSVTAVGGGGLAPCPSSAAVTDFATAAVAMQNPYGMSPMAHMAQFGSAASTYQYCNTDLSHYASNPASAAAWYGSSTTDPRFASKLKA